MAFGAGVSTVGFFFVVDRPGLDHGFYDRLLAAKVSRHTIVSDRGPVQHADRIPFAKDRFFAQGKHYAKSVGRHS
jgi:hypothetical protein